MSVFDIGVVFCGVFISYFGERGHKPKILGISFVIQGIGSLLFALPHFIFGKYQVGTDVQGTFEACNDTIEALSSCDAGNSIAYAIFIIANLVMGIGAASLFTVGISFIDDIVFPKWVSLHVGAFQVCTIIGPALGFGLGSVFLTIYVDPGEPTTLTEEDPGWVGAWWLCFIVIGIVSIIGSIPFFFFPRFLSDSHLVKAERLKQMTGTYKGRFGDESTFLKQVKAFPFHLWGLFKSKSWFFMTVGVTVLFLGLDGLIAFAPKYLETVYQVPSSTAGLLIGAVGKLLAVCSVLMDLNNVNKIISECCLSILNSTHLCESKLCAYHVISNTGWGHWSTDWSIDSVLCQDWQEDGRHTLGGIIPSSHSSHWLLVCLPQCEYCWN